MTTFHKTLIALGAACAVGSLSAATLVHQWTFDDANDSVGGANLTLLGSATLSGGNLVLPGGPKGTSAAQIDISNTLNTSQSLSVEAWFTMEKLQNWSKLWMFGTAGAQPGLSYINFTPRMGASGNVPKLDFDTQFGNELNTAGGANPAVLAASRLYHAVAVYDADTDTQYLYIDGVLADTGPMGGGKISQINPAEMFFGRAVNFGDADFGGTIGEISIWTGALTAEEVAQEFKAGVDGRAVIPEPSVLSLGLLAGLGLFRRRRAS